MQSENLNQNNCSKLIIFFNGWSLDKNIVNHLISSNYDVIMFYDYSDLEIDENIIKAINNYEEINIIAWSFGVWACSCVIDKFKTPKNVIAINGTPVPIDDNFGIPEKIFNLTLSNLSEKNYVRFFKNMFVDKPDLSKLPKRNVENQRQELINIKNSLPAIIKQELFTKVFVGIQDKIISPKNQLRFWDSATIIKVDKGHYIFDLFKTWDEIING
jgi:pimeloyl-[acyl-carrier protein] methyl ester esterase